VPLQNGGRKGSIEEETFHLVKRQVYFPAILGSVEFGAVEGAVALVFVGALKGLAAPGAVSCGGFWHGFSTEIFKCGSIAEASSQRRRAERNRK
jgi:hypothetical protein